MNSLYDRIKSRLDALGKSERQASLEATSNPDTIRRIRKGRTAHPRSDTIAGLAKALETNAEWLMGNDIADHNAPQTKAIQPIKQNDAVTGMLPLYGMVAASITGSLTMTNDPVEYVQCPVGLIHVQDAYALRVTGESMLPRYEPDEIVFAHPHRPVKCGDHVIIQQRVDGGTAASIKRYEKTTEQFHVTTQYNPQSVIEFPVSTVFHMHRVLTSNEALGV